MLLPRCPSRAPGMTVAAVLLLCSACASNDSRPQAEAFGSSVRHMIDQQIFDPRAASAPSTDPSAGTDGARAAAAMKAYRDQAGKPATSMARDVPIGVSNQ
jgi:hypothetical protein